MPGSLRTLIFGTGSVFLPTLSDLMRHAGPPTIRLVPPLQSSLATKSNEYSSWLYARREDVGKEEKFGSIADLLSTHYRST
ncbi:hypothetical protein M9H77_31749 [Catharanthus roseus]|uniref:Uncharacterized protein n=1 Tax=Catharanthus roseus TaxID=4058 RepID=A0ACC0A292_CATRO|nr:hypothetical protein M9H77_31749 [Catharanthus roseus]